MAATDEEIKTFLDATERTRSSRLIYTISKRVLALDHIAFLEGVQEERLDKVLATLARSSEAPHVQKIV